MNDEQALSKLLWECRESVEMWADVVEAQRGKPDEYTRKLVARVDAYRAERGWSPHGFGNEPPAPSVVVDVPNRDTE